MHIDWNEPQPTGTYRCERGWSDTTGADFGCTERATAEVLSEYEDTGQTFTEHLCTDHALIAQLAGMQNVLSHRTETADARAEQMISVLDGLTENVWSLGEHVRTLSWYTQPRWQRAVKSIVYGYRWVASWVQYYRHRRGMAQDVIERENEASSAVRRWLKHPTPTNAKQAVIDLIEYANPGYLTTARNDWAQEFIEGTTTQTFEDWFADRHRTGEPTPQIPELENWSTPEVAADLLARYTQQHSKGGEEE